MSGFKLSRLPSWLQILFLLLILIAVSFVSLGLGSSESGFSDLLSLFKGELTGSSRMIILELRLPRILLALLTGLALASGGTVYQALLRNPLAEPYILGISGGAAVGAILCSLAGCQSKIVCTGASFVIAMLTSLLVMAISRRRNMLNTNILILAGVVLNTFFSALIVLFLSLVRDPQSHTVFFWLMGNLGMASLSDVAVLAVPVLSLFLLIWLYGFRLNLIHLGEENAKQAGISVEKDKWILFAVSSFMAAATVSFTGIIGFVGLIMPHIARRIFGADHRGLVPTSAICGAIFLVFADAISRSIAAPVELPVGVVTAAFGVPFFLGLLWRERA